jgi:hypothetical protein
VPEPGFHRDFGAVFRSPVDSELAKGGNHENRRTGEAVAHQRGCRQDPYSRKDLAELTDVLSLKLNNKLN